MKRQGFTILEILVVLAVLAILIGIAVPRIKGMQEQANITKAKSELKTIQLAVESYRMNHGSYPEKSGDNCTKLTETLLIKESPQIVPGIMYDPFGATVTSEYFYMISVDTNYYVIGSLGTSGKKVEDALDVFLLMGTGGCFVQEALDLIAAGMIVVTNGSGTLCE
ncbi:MAG TPA: prepilin-type N-terminal cleavage/methylation domain-containing protein [Candidatus Omnitrophota bacterium]|nr:prepilin-type N-terminal cleavage/methylation domain-containing protein [Candidatus Omnitrophota bacterium]